MGNIPIVFYTIQHMRADKNAGPLVAQLLENLLELLDGVRVQPYERLIEYGDAGPGQ